jgi:uncharacterized membrane protein
MSNKKKKKNSFLKFRFSLFLNNLSIYWNSNVKSRLDLPKEDIIVCLNIQIIL